MSPHRCSLLFNRSWQVRQTTRGLHSNGWAGEYSSMRVRKNLLRDKVKVAQCSPISEHIHLKRYILGDVFSLLLVQSRFFSRKSEAPLKNKAFWKFPGSPVVRTRGFTAKGPGSIPGWGTKISQTGQHGQKKKKKKVIRYMSKTILLDFPIPTSESLFLQDKNGENLHLNFISSAHMLTESSWFSNFLASCKPSPFHLNLLLSPVSTSCLIILYLLAPSCSFTLDGSS